MITTFTELHDKMEGRLKELIPNLVTVDAYTEAKPTDKIKTPAVLVGVDEMQSGKKVSGGRLAMTCMFNAYCLLSTKTPRAVLEIRNLAAVLAAQIDGERWGLGEAVGRPANINAVPGIFQSSQPGLECWVVSWEQVVHIGDKWTPPSEDEPQSATAASNNAVNTPPVAGCDVWLDGCHDDSHYLGKVPE